MGFLFNFKRKNFVKHGLKFIEQNHSKIENHVQLCWNVELPVPAARIQSSNHQPGPACCALKLSKDDSDDAGHVDLLRQRLGRTEFFSFFFWQLADTPAMTVARHHHAVGPDSSSSSAAGFERLTEFVECHDRQNSSNIFVFSQASRCLQRASQLQDRVVTVLPGRAPTQSRSQPDSARAWQQPAARDSEPERPE